MNEKKERKEPQPGKGKSREKRQPYVKPTIDSSEVFESFTLQSCEFDDECWPPTVQSG
jgi:hypothetical protein